MENVIVGHMHMQQSLLTHDFKIKRIKILARVCLLYIDKKCFSLYV